MEIFSNLKCCLDVTSAIPFRQDILESYMYENCDLVVSVNILMVVCMPLFLGQHDTQLCALIRDYISTRISSVGVDNHLCVFTIYAYDSVKLLNFPSTSSFLVNQCLLLLKK